MRCIGGLVLFIALYVSSCTILGGIVRTNYGMAAGAEAVRKYHALVAVGVGIFSLGACCLPGILARKSREAELRAFEDWNEPTFN